MVTQTMKKKDPSLCEIKGCYNELAIRYYGHSVCQKHWDNHCDKGFDLKKALNIIDTTPK